MLRAQLALLLAAFPGDPGVAALDAATLQRWRARMAMAHSLVVELEGRTEAEMARKGLVRELAGRLEPIGSAAPGLAASARELLRAVQDLESSVRAAREEETWLQLHDWCLELGQATGLRAELGPHAIGRVLALAKFYDLLRCPHLAAVLAASLPEGEGTGKAATSLLDQAWVLDGIGGQSACQQVDAGIGGLRLHDWKPDHAAGPEVVLGLLDSLARRADGGEAIARLERKANELSEAPAASCEELVRDQVALFQRLEALGGSVSAPRLSIEVHVGQGRPDPEPPGLEIVRTTPIKVLVGCQERPGEWTELPVAPAGFPSFAALRYALQGDSGARLLLPKATKKELKEITVTIPENWPKGYWGIIEKASNQDVLWIRESNLSASELSAYAKAMKRADANINLNEDHVDAAAWDQWKKADSISLIPWKEHWAAFELLHGQSKEPPLLHDVEPKDWNRVHDMVRTKLGSAGK